MTIRASKEFKFNGEYSSDYGIVNVNIQNGMQSEPFGANRSIREQKIRGNDRPYFMGIELQPLEFTVSFAFKNKFNNELIRDVAIWLLSPKYYAPLLFSDDGDKQYFCLCVDSPELIHNTLKNGYINLHFRCADAYAYSGVEKQIELLSTNPAAGTIVNAVNWGITELKPKVEIKKIGNGNVSIFNNSDGGAEMTFNGLLNNETITIDCDNRVIATDVPLTERYSSMIGNYLSLTRGSNFLLIKGTCEIAFSYQFKLNP